MPINKISIRNFMSLKALTLEPGKLNVIKGKNRLGKTAILKAIQAALTGKIDPSQVTTDEKTCEISIELESHGSKVQVTRTMNGGKSSVEVKKNGQAVNRAAAFLQDLIPDVFAFNPVEFFLLPPRERRRYLASLCGKFSVEDLRPIGTFLGPVDLSKIEDPAEYLDTVAKGIFQQRSTIETERRQMKGAAEALEKEIPEDLLTVEPEAFAKAQREAQDMRTKAAVAKEQAEAKLRQFAQGEKELDEINEQIRQLTARREEVIKQLAGKSAAEDALKTAAAKLKAAEAHCQDLAPKMEAVIKAKEARRKREQEAELKAKHEKMTEALEYIRKDLYAKIAAPLKKLGVEIAEDGSITKDGVAIDNLNDEQRLRLAVDLARRLNNKIGLICIDGLESLDSQRREELMQQIEADDSVQWFLTQVSDDAKLVVETAQNVAL